MLANGSPERSGLSPLVGTSSASLREAPGRSHPAASLGPRVKSPVWTQRDRRLPAPSRWEEFTGSGRSCIPCLGSRRGEERDAGASGALGELQGFRAPGEAPRFLSPTGTLQQGKGVGSSLPPAQASLKAGGTRASADARPGPVTTCPASLQPLCSFCFSSSTSGKHWLLSGAPPGHLG